MLHLLPFSVTALCSLTLTSAAPPPPLPAALPFQTNTTRPGIRPACVPTFAPWQGPLLYTDCLTAWNDLTNQYAIILASFFAFYTTSSGFVPPPGGDRDMRWKLPFSTTFQTCTLQIRMIRDFHPHEQPLTATADEFLSPHDLPPAGISSWGSTLRDAKPVLDACVRRGAPGWTTDGFASAGGRVWAPIGIFMWPAESAMARTYNRRGGPAGW